MMNWNELEFFNHELLRSDAVQPILTTDSVGLGLGWVGPLHLTALLALLAFSYVIIIKFFL